jgi:hypothetical protein
MPHASNAMAAHPLVLDARHGRTSPPAPCAPGENPAPNRSPVPDTPRDSAEARITTGPAERLSGVNKPLTPKRQTRVVENDEYAAFLRRVIRGYSRRIAAGDIEAIGVMAALADHLEDATRQAITGLRQIGYSWADIALRLGITRQGAQQRWGDTPVFVTDDGSTATSRSCP